MKKGGKNILIIEDDLHIAEGMRLNLSLQGHAVIIAPDGISGLRRWKETQPDLIVLDIMLPHIDGISVLRSIRLEDERIPILIVSAKGDPDDRVRGLSYGVDDYLTKPFSLEEFLLRVEGLLKKVSWYRDESDEDRATLDAPAGTYAFGENVIDFTTNNARCKEGMVTLTEQEVKLLKLFIANRGKPLSRKSILEIGWGYPKGTTTRTVDNFIVRFRRYFEENPQTPAYFKSVRSVGYLFDHD
ncbi:MAG: response regulator transcription factor [Deltaproteobacteria bacterium]|nr:response regulator transcription factor [Deltaproteobacteria bacterium]MBN2686935.1 response regulator transcription factor [Deltaproteobacteria bacterium]